MLQISSPRPAPSSTITSRQAASTAFLAGKKNIKFFFRTKHRTRKNSSSESYYLFIGEFAIFRVLTHLVPYLKIQRILVDELTSMTPKSKNTCRKLRVSAFKRY